MQLNLKKLGLVLVPCLGLGAACGDDDQPGTPDGGGTPDADTTFYEQPMTFDAEDGGEIRLENVVFPDGRARTVLTTHFIKDQEGRMPFPNVGGEGAAYCNDVTTEEIYPFGAASNAGATAAWEVPGRVYADVGPFITFNSSAGSFVMDRMFDYIVPLAGGLQHDISYNPTITTETGGFAPYEVVDPILIGGTGLNPNGLEVSVTMPGGPDLDRALTFDFETKAINAAGETADFTGLRMPPRANATGFAQEGVPADGNIFGAGGPALQIPDNADFVIEWENAEEQPADLLTFLAVFSLATGAPDITHLCIQPTPGRHELPQEIINSASFQSSGLIFLAQLQHRLRTFDNVRRIDVVSMTCTSAYYEVVTP